MDENRKRITPQEFLAYLRSLPPDKLREFATRVLQVNVNQARSAGDKASKVARCEEFFDTLDLLLPSHESSRQEANQLLERLCAGKPNLPPELRS